MIYMANLNKEAKTVDLCEYFQILNRLLSVSVTQDTRF